MTASQTSASTLVFWRRPAASSPAETTSRAPESHRLRHLGQGFAPHEMRVAARQFAFALVGEAAPQQFGDDEAEDAVAQEFEPLVAAARAAAAAHCARMRQRFGRAARAARIRGPGVAARLRAARPYRSCQWIADEEPAVAHRERPFPRLPPARHSRRWRRRGTRRGRRDFPPARSPRRCAGRGCRRCRRGCRPS